MQSHFQVFHLDAKSATLLLDLPCLAGDKNKDGRRTEFQWAKYL